MNARDSMTTNRTAKDGANPTRSHTMTKTKPYQIFVGGVFSDLIRTPERSLPSAALRAWADGQKASPTCCRIFAKTIADAQTLREWVRNHPSEALTILLRQTCYDTGYLLQKCAEEWIPTENDRWEEAHNILEVEPFTMG